MNLSGFQLQTNNRLSSFVKWGKDYFMAIVTLNRIHQTHGIEHEQSIIARFFPSPRIWERFPFGNLIYAYCIN